MLVHHFSEDDSISRFVPHVPRTNPEHPPAVWAIDADHAPLYWFPRQCPRVTVWARSDDPAAYQAEFATTAPRVHYMEFGWLDRMSNVRLFRYDFDGSEFQPWPEATGQWIAETLVEPLRCEPVGDLFEQHRRAGIELRLVHSLRPIAERAQSDRWHFSMVRMRNAAG